MCLNNGAQSCTEMKLEIVELVDFGTFAVVCEGNYTDSWVSRVPVAIKFPKNDDLAVAALENE